MTESQKALWFDTALDCETVASVISPHRWTSVREAARRLNRPKSKALYKCLRDLTDAGILETRFRRLPNGVDMLQYRKLLSQS